MERMKKIFTVGHSTRSIEEFIEILQEFKIETLADVRLFPGSRRYPHFNSDSLRFTLQENDIGYKHFSGLGGRRKPKPDSRNAFWENEAFRGYADYMETADFKTNISELSLLASEKVVAIMCAEAVWWRCHRRLIADWLVLKGWNVHNIMDKGKAAAHKPNDAAKYLQGNLFYSS